jgi:adenosylhomocysteine nucleosidase
MRSFATVLCTSGLAAEAKIARLAGFSVVVGAGNRQRTAALVEAAAADAKCLVSFGIAGGLLPGLRPGSVVVSGEVVTEDRRWCVEPPFRRRIAELAQAIGAIEGAVFGAETVIVTAREKVRSWAETGALIVDTESDIVARAANAAGIPFIVMRAVADPAHRSLPPAALIPLAPDGTPEHLRILADVLRRPWQIAGLVSMVCDARCALSALVAPVRALTLAAAA